MAGDIPRKVLGSKKAKDMTAEELAEQNERISDWLIKRAAEEAAKKLEKGQ